MIVNKHFHALRTGHKNFLRLLRESEASFDVIQLHLF